MSRNFKWIGSLDKLSLGQTKCLEVHKSAPSRAQYVLPMRSTQYKHEHRLAQHTHDHRSVWDHTHNHRSTWGQPNTHMIIDQLNTHMIIGRLEISPIHIWT